jgi:hypothetical protein
MNLRQCLITLIDTYAAAKGLSASRVSQLLFSSGAKYSQLVSGASINVDRFEGAVAYLDSNWPADTPWPEGIVRPSALPTAETEG